MLNFYNDIEDEDDPSQDDWLDYGDDEEDDPVTKLALGNPEPVQTYSPPPMEEVRPPVVIPEEPKTPIITRDFFETSAPSVSSPSAAPTPTRSVLDDIWDGRPAQPKAPEAPTSRWNTPPNLQVPQTDTEYGRYIQDLRDQGLWGDQYGAPVGGGKVVVGGGGVAPQASYITSVTYGAGAGAGSSALNGPRVATDTPEKEKVRIVGETARAAGLDDEAAKILQTVVLSEGGLTGRKGDQGQSHGVYQFHERGQLPGFAAWLGVPIEQARELANDPVLATKYAASTYLKGSIERGRAMGLKGADLAHYVQGPDGGGQVSSYPERAAASWNEWFGDGRDPFKTKAPDQGQMDAAVASQTPPPAPKVSTLKGITPSQLDLANSDADYLALCGPVAATAFANAAGIKLSVADAKQAAIKGGWWDANNGMYGPAAATKLINNLGVKASYKEGVDWKEVAQNVTSGKPVILNAMTTGGKIGHYFVVEDYDPTTGKFYLGNSLLTLKKEAHGGNAWVTPQELSAMQSRTQINTQVSGMILMDQPSVAQCSNSRTILFRWWRNLCYDISRLPRTCPHSNSGRCRQ
jgi:hypothetical protein